MKTQITAFLSMILATSLLASCGETNPPNMSLDEDTGESDSDTDSDTDGDGDSDGDGDTGDSGDSDI